jgi:hypothetical protein
VTLNRDPLDITAINGGHELAKDDFRLASVLLVEHAENDEENQR